MEETNDNSSGARIDALEAKVDAVLAGLAAQIANLSQSEQDAQPGVCIHTGIDPSEFVIADCAANAASDGALSGSEGVDTCDASSGASSSNPKAFDLEFEDAGANGENENGEETKVYYLRRCWIMRGGVSNHIADLKVEGLDTSATSSIVALKIKLYPLDEYSAKAYSSVSALTSEQEDDQYYIVPLWQISGEDRSEWIDLRTQAFIQAFETVG